MAEEKDTEKELPASERRLQQAREEGNIPRSRELAGGTILLGAVLILSALATPLLTKSESLMRLGLQLKREDAFDPLRMLNQFASMLLESLWILMPVLLIAIVGAILSNVAIGGLIISGKGLTPDFSRINPAKGLANIFSSNGLFELIKAVVKASAIGYLGYWLINRHTEKYVAMSAMPLEHSLNESASLAIGDAIYFALLFFFLVALDVPYQLWKYYKQMRMSLEDLKQESRDSDGDPHLKARIRQLQREAARKRMMAAVPQADVVVTNPTHYSVALKYDREKGGAPKVVAKGMGEVALKIRELAKEHRVPVMEVPALARALYRHVELEREIPDTLYTVVAKLLAYIYALSSGRAHMMAPVTEADVPPGLDPGVDTTET